MPKLSLISVLAPASINNFTIAVLFCIAAIFNGVDSDTPGIGSRVVVFGDSELFGELSVFVTFAAWPGLETVSLIGSGDSVPEDSGMSVCKGMPGILFYG